MRPRGARMARQGAMCAPIKTFRGTQYNGRALYASNSITEAMRLAWRLPWASTFALGLDGGRVERQPKSAGAITCKLHPGLHVRCSGASGGVHVLAASASKVGHMRPKAPNACRCRPKLWWKSPSNGRIRPRLGTHPPHPAEDIPRLAESGQACTLWLDAHPIKSIGDALSVRLLVNAVQKKTLEIRTQTRMANLLAEADSDLRQRGTMQDVEAAKRYRHDARDTYDLVSLPRLAWMRGQGRLSLVYPHITSRVV